MDRSPAVFCQSRRVVGICASPALASDRTIPPGIIADDPTGVHGGLLVLSAPGTGACRLIGPALGTALGPAFAGSGRVTASEPTQPMMAVANTAPMIAESVANRI